MNQRDVPFMAHLSPVVLGVVAIVAFTGGFITDLWRVADKTWFTGFQRDSESAVMGRLVQSRQSGVLSAGGLLGRGGSPGKGGNDYQFIAYSRGLTFTNYTPYLSQTGGQGMLLSILDAALPMAPSSKLRLFRLATSFLTALALTSLVLWFYAELGLFAGACVLASTVFAQWLVVFGRNLYWSLWAVFIPVIVVGYYVMHTSWPRGRQYLALGALAFLAVFVKCFVNGYEYITPTLVMMLLPLVYYAIIGKVGFGRLVRGTAVVSLGASLAIAVSLTILAFQIASLGGGLSGGVGQITTSLLKRTYGNPSDLDPMYRVSLETSPAHVLGQYLTGVFFDPGRFASSELRIASAASLPIRYYHLIAALMLSSSAMLWMNSRRGAGQARTSRAALVATAWSSLAGPMSWFLIFKSHAAAHYHIDFVVWQMPFTLFVFATIGLLVRDVAVAMAARRKGPPMAAQQPV